MNPMTHLMPASSRPLRGSRIVSLALNLPGPAALLRLKNWGASCVKIEPPVRLADPPAAQPAPPPKPGRSSDPMQFYSPQAYADLHAGIRTRVLDLKSAQGQAALQRELARADVLLTSFRPSALRKLGLNWHRLRRQHPNLSLVGIVGATGARAEEPGHDLTYMAQAGLITGHDLPPSLFADMAGALMTSEAVLSAVLSLRLHGKARQQQVVLDDAARWLALPLHWGMTMPPAPPDAAAATDTVLTGGMVGGAHAGYRVYACKNGRVALAALEPHFARRICALAAVPFKDISTMMQAGTHRALADWMARHTALELARMAHAHDIPLHAL